jgi:hypothetical protein
VFRDTFVARYCPQTNFEELRDERAVIIFEGKTPMEPSNFTRAIGDNF